MTDTYEKLDIGIPFVEKILHVADIHIRLTKRHEEYREVFQKLYTYVDTMPTNSAIAILGDTLHSKVDLSPEAVQLASEFLRSCADRRPTILIAGNHDCLLTNKTRLDSISPIVTNLSHKNLFYLRESKLYGAANILLNNMSIFDDPTSYIKMKNVTKRLRREFDTTVALFHGPVNRAQTDMGFSINNRSITVDTFDGHDIALLGDIHKMQTMYIEHRSSEKADVDGLLATGEWSTLSGPDDLSTTYVLRKKFPIIRYSSSLLQQNHGENLRDHGFSVWDVKSRTFEHVEMLNDYGYYTIEVVGGKLETDITDMPSKAKLRVNCKESMATDVKRVITDIRKTHQISDLVQTQSDLVDANRASVNQTASNLSQIGSVEYQNELIGEYLKDRYPEIDEDTLLDVYKINTDLNSTINKDDRNRNIRWKPKLFEFDNMFSYGEGNVIDFSKLNDVFGLFAANASGKSSLMDALSFTAFDKSSKAFKASHIMNSQKMSFKGKFTFEVNGVDYVIVRSGSRDKKNNVKVEVNFYKKDGDKEVPLNAEARRSTNEVIRDFLGSYDDFILTTLSLQNNHGSFVDIGQTERKELLAKFIGITIFEKLSDNASDRMKEISGALKAFNKEDNTQKIAEMENEIGVLSSKILDLEQRSDDVSKKISSLREKVATETSSIVNLVGVPTTDQFTSLTSERMEAERMVLDSRGRLSECQRSLSDEKGKLAVLLTRADELEKIPLNEKKELMGTLQRQFDALNVKMSKLKTLVSEKLKKLDHLSKHEYDPNCKFCTNNVFVKDAMSTRESLEADKSTARQYVEEITSVRKKLDGLMEFKDLISESDGIEMKIAVQQSVVSRCQLDVNNMASILDKTAGRIIKIDELIGLYNRSREVVEQNSAVEVSVRGLNEKIEQLTRDLRGMGKEHLVASGRRTSLTDQVSIVNKKISEIESYQNTYSAYEYYLSAVGTSGLQYKIISSAVPRIESEVNNILSQIVEFTMNIDTDGKNINVFIKYEDRKWPLELCSGMEKFIAGLALRVALINISNIPRPNFLVVDEGFGALDADNMGTMHALFDFLKVNFDFIIVISHLDAMRDMVDKQLEIHKENGFSKIDNSK